MRVIGKMRGRICYRQERSDMNESEETARKNERDERNGKGGSNEWDESGERRPWESSDTLQTGGREGRRQCTVYYGEKDGRSASLRGGGGVGEEGRGGRGKQEEELRR